MTAVVDLEASPPRSGELQPQLPSNPAAAVQMHGHGQRLLSAAHCQLQPTLEQFMIDGRLGLQRSLLIVGIFVLSFNAVGDYTEPGGLLRHWIAWFHNFAAVGALVIALLASRWRRFPLFRHWFLFGVVTSYMLFLSFLWPAGDWWDGPGHLSGDISDEPGPPIWFWGIGVAGASRWRIQVVVAVAMYAYYLPLKVNATPNPFKVDVGIANMSPHPFPPPPPSPPPASPLHLTPHSPPLSQTGISLGMSCVIAIATSYLREREDAQRYAARFARGRMRRTGSLAVPVELEPPPLGLRQVFPLPPLGLPPSEPDAAVPKGTRTRGEVENGVVDVDVDGPLAPRSVGVDAGADELDLERPAADRGGEGGGGGGGGPTEMESRGRRLLRRVTLAFPDPTEEEGFRVWSVRYARRRTLLYASALLTAFTVVRAPIRSLHGSSVILWNRSRKASNPGEASKVIGILIGGVVPGAAVLLSAVPRRLWEGFYARKWVHQWAVTLAAVAASASCMALLGQLPGGRLHPSREDTALWWALVLLSNSVPLCLVTLRVRFAFALGWLACWLASFAAVFAVIDRGTRLLTTSACFLALSMAATRDIERERRALWRESVAALEIAAGPGRGRAASTSGLELRAHAHDP
eukprot:tig00000254_g22574.t1